MIPARPSDVRIPVGYPNDDPTNGAGMSQRDYDDGEIGFDDLRTIAELVEMRTVAMAHPELVRRHVAMFVAAAVEAGLLMGVGTMWRSKAAQQANWERWPTQFSNPLTSYHVEVPPLDVALACDVIPGDSWPWMHANAQRFGLIHLTANEQHHTQLVEIPRPRRVFNSDPAAWTSKIQHLTLPYLGNQSIDEWLATDAPFKEATIPTKPDPDPIIPDIEEDDMLPAVAKPTDGAHLVQFKPGGPVYTMGGEEHDFTTAEVFCRYGGGKAYDIVNGKVVSLSLGSEPRWSATKTEKSKAQILALMSPTA